MILEELGLTVEDVREAAAESIPARASGPACSARASRALPLGTVIGGEDILRESLRLDERERSSGPVALPPLPPADCSVAEAAEYDRALLRFLDEGASSRVVARYGDRLLAQSAAILARARQRAGRRGTRARRAAQARALLADYGLLQDGAA